MKGTKLITGMDKDEFQSALDVACLDIAQEDDIVDIKFSTTGTSGAVTYSALIIFE